MDLAELYNTQISLHEWFERIGHTHAQAVKDEDLTRQKRLETLNSIINLPYDKPEVFIPTDVLNHSERFETFFDLEKNKKCRLRLLPLSKDAQKLRTVGRTVTESIEWFKEQNVDPKMYELHFLSFTENPQWATIFIINKYGIFGDAVWGGHNQLTQGFYTNKPITFTYNFDVWNLSESNSNLLEHLKQITSKIFVPDANKKTELKTKLNAQFTHDYLMGYFETVSDKDILLQFIDYNRILGDLYKDFKREPKNSFSSQLVGQAGSPGIISGKVKIVARGDIEQTLLKSDEILVCEMTSPDYIPLMKQALGIITDKGGILSHAAIISRELDKPCIVGTGNATTQLKNGQQITLDATKGTILI